MRRLLCTLIVLLCGLGSAAAERLVVSLSNHRVAVTSSFVGEELVLFGTIEPDPVTSPLRPPYDLVVTVTGPRQTLRTRRKQRVLGIWVNVDSREFERVPSYLAVLSNRPVNNIANQDTLRRLQIGLDNFLLPQRIGSDVADTVREDPFRRSFLRLQTQQGLYREVSHCCDVPHANRVSRGNPDACRRSNRKLWNRGRVVHGRQFGRPNELSTGCNQDWL